MLSKEEFCRIVARLQAASDLRDNVNRLYRESRDNIDDDFLNAAALQINHEHIVIDLLRRIMNNQSELIDYFIYEIDYGRKYHEGCVIVDDKPIDVSTAEKLYDYLINCQ